MHFGENQLSRSLIGLSPLPTAHPPGFQPRRVRPSTRSYTCLSLAMGRSPRFGSRTRHCTPSFGLALATATPHGLTSRHATDSQAHSSIGTPPPPPPRTRGGTGSDGSQAPGFRYSFTPLPGYFSPFPHGTHPLSVTRTYSGSQVVLADSHRIPRAPCYNGHAPTPTPTRFRLRGYHPLRHAIPDASATRPRKRPAPAETGNKHAPQPRRRNPRRVSHDNGLAIIRFRSPLLTVYPLLRVLRCFTSPRHPPHPIQFRHE